MSSKKKSKSGKPASSNVIDISERISARAASRNPLERLKAIKVRLDLEQAKIAIPASLLSIVVVVTIANSNLLKTPEVVSSRELASEGTVIPPQRGIASIPTSTTESEDELVRTMAGKTLSEAAALGRKPSALEKLSFETLEGKYAIKMDEAQKISEIEIAENQVASPVAFDAGFIEKNRTWFPVGFEKSIRVQTAEADPGSRQTYHLVNGLSMPVARVDVRLDSAGRLLALKVVPTTVAETK